MFNNAAYLIKGPVKALLTGFLCLCAGSCIHKAALDGGQQEIDFTANDTKAAVAGFTTGDSFSVWGYYMPSDTPSASGTEIFNAKEVTFDGSSWSYEGKQYWYPGNTYDFYAVFPHSVNALVTLSYGSGNRNIEINGFDATGSIDLMTAESTGIVCDGNGQGPVGLQFGHRLAQVSFIGKIDPSTNAVDPDFQSRIISAKLYGMYSKGDLHRSGTAAVWTINGYDRTTEDAPFVSYSETSDGMKIITGTAEAPVFDSDVLALPTNDMEDIYFHVEYAIKEGTSQEWETFSREIALNTLSANWENGKSYRYVMTFRGNYIDFSVNVNPWNESTGGIITVE